MNLLTSYLIERAPQGLEYRDAAQLCQWLFCCESGVPDDIRPLTKEVLADAFSELAAQGWVRDQYSWYRCFYGAHWHQIVDRGHWVEVVASQFKNAEAFEFESAERVARRFGFLNEK
jgi:hypothetical protein